MNDTLCYKIVFQIIGHYYSDGYLVVDVEQGNITGITGFLTYDFLWSVDQGDDFRIEYYSKAERGFIPLLQYVIPKEIFHMPIHQRFNIKGYTLQLNTTERIDDPFEKYRIIKLVKDYRNKVVG